MEIKKITLDGWTMFSDRINSKNYISSDGKLLLKTFTLANETSIDDLKQQKAFTDKVIELGIPTPKVVDIVDAEGCLGVIYDYVTEKVSVSRALMNNYENRHEYIKKFADFAKFVHSVDSDTSFFPSHIENIKKGLAKMRFFSDLEKENIVKIIDSLPNETKCVFQDFQYSNVILSQGKAYAIDLGTFSYGSPIMDIAFLYGFSKILPDHVIEKILHLNRAKANECFDLFLHYYYDDKSEEEITIIHKKLHKLSFISLLSMCTVMDNEKIMEMIYKYGFKDAFLTDEL